MCKMKVFSIYMKFLRSKNSLVMQPIWYNDFFFEDRNQRTNGPVNAHLISGPTVCTKTSFANFDIDLIWVKVNSGSLFI